MLLSRGLEVEDGTNDSVNRDCVAYVGDDFRGWLIYHRRLIAGKSFTDSE